MSVYDWSTTAATNATADAAINWQEGMLPSLVNDSARATMAAIKALVRDIGGAAALGGVGNAFELVLSQPMATRQPALLSFVATRTNTGAVTMKIDGTAAAPLRFKTGVDIPAGRIVNGAYYLVSFKSSTGEYMLSGPQPISLGDLPSIANQTFLANFSGSAAIPYEVSIATIPAFIPDNTISNTKLPQAPAFTIKSNLTGAVANVTDTPITSLPRWTRTVLTSGTSFAVPANAARLHIKMVGGGGGGGGTGGSGTGNNGASGTDTVFNGIHAKGGGGGGGTNVPAFPAIGGEAGLRGSGGTGSASLRLAGQTGAGGASNYFATGIGNPASIGGSGGNSFLGGAGAATINNLTNRMDPASNSGSGGAGATSSLQGLGSAGGGGGAEYVEIIIDSPAASYAYTIGAGGNGGAAGTSGVAGADGAAGMIIVETHFY